jgi:hypothetical protein
MRPFVEEMGDFYEMCSVLSSASKTFQHAVFLGKDCTGSLQRVVLCSLWAKGQWWGNITA